MKMKSYLNWELQFEMTLGTHSPEELYQTTHFVLTEDHMYCPPLKVEGVLSLPFSVSPY